MRRFVFGCRSCEILLFRALMCVCVCVCVCNMCEVLCWGVKIDLITELQTDQDKDTHGKRDRSEGSSLRAAR